MSEFDRSVDLQPDSLMLRRELVGV